RPAQPCPPSVAPAGCATAVAGLSPGIGDCRVVATSGWARSRAGYARLIESSPLHVLVLGPIQVNGPSGTAVLTGARQRAVAGLLGVHAGTVLCRSRLVEALWADYPPRTAVKI